MPLQMEINALCEGCKYINTIDENNHRTIQSGCRRNKPQGLHIPRRTGIEMKSPNSVVTALAIFMKNILSYTLIDVGCTNIDDFISALAWFIEHKEEDRLNSKRAFKRLKLGHGAPGTQYHQSLSVELCDTYREHVLEQDIKIRFMRQDMIWFFNSIIDKL